MMEQQPLMSPIVSRKNGCNGMICRNYVVLIWNYLAVCHGRYALLLFKHQAIVTKGQGVFFLMDRATHLYKDQLKPSLE